MINHGDPLAVLRRNCVPFRVGGQWLGSALHFTSPTVIFQFFNYMWTYARWEERRLLCNQVLTVLRWNWLELTSDSNEEVCRQCLNAFRHSFFQVALVSFRGLVMWVVATCIIKALFVLMRAGSVTFDRGPFFPPHDMLRGSGLH